jgi:hypothetical protein
MIGLPLLALNVMNEQINSGKSFVINTNSDVYEYKGEFTLDSLYKALDCETIEVINLKDNLILICDEEALFRTYPVVNTIATNMYRDAYNTNEVGIIGKCIICQSSKLS